MRSAHTVFVNFAHIFSGGEMQGTIVDEYCPDPWTSYIAGKEVLVPKHWHYRLVLDTVGYGFNRVSGTKELLHAAYDVFHGTNVASYCRSVY